MKRNRYSYIAYSTYLTMTRKKKQAGMCTSVHVKLGQVDSEVNNT